MKETSKKKKKELEETTRVRNQTRAQPYDHKHTHTQDRVASAYPTEKIRFVCVCVGIEIVGMELFLVFFLRGALSRCNVPYRRENASEHRHTRAVPFCWSGDVRLWVFFFSRPADSPRGKRRGRKKSVGRIVWWCRCWPPPEARPKHHDPCGCVY